VVPVLEPAASHPESAAPIVESELVSLIPVDVPSCSADSGDQSVAADQASTLDSNSAECVATVPSDFIAEAVSNVEATQVDVVISPEASSVSALTSQVSAVEDSFNPLHPWIELVDEETQSVYYENIEVCCFTICYVVCLLW
jgi:hypothetical protein